MLTYNSGDFAAFFVTERNYVRSVASRISNRFLSHSLQFCTVAVHIVVHVGTKTYPEGYQCEHTVADPDLQIEEGGGGSWSSRPGENGGAVSKNFFRPFGPQFGLKIREMLGPPRAPPLDPPLI